MYPGSSSAGGTPTQPPSATTFKVGEAIGLSLGALGILVTIFTVDKPWIIIATGIASVVLACVIAGAALWRRSYGSALVAACTAFVFVVATAGYAAYNKANASGLARGQATQAGTGASPAPAPTAGGASPAPSEASEADAVFSGTLVIMGGQAVDFEAANPEAVDADLLKSPYDFHVNATTVFVRDRVGPTPMYTGDIAKGRQGCQRLLKTGPRSPISLVVFGQYCVATSDGRIALVVVESSSLIPYGRSGEAHIGFTVWNA